MFCNCERILNYYRYFPRRTRTIIIFPFNFPHIIRILQSLLNLRHSGSVYIYVICIPQKKIEDMQNSDSPRKLDFFLIFFFQILHQNFGGPNFFEAKFLKKLSTNPKNGFARVLSNVKRNKVMKNQLIIHPLKSHQRLSTGGGFIDKNSRLKQFWVPCDSCNNYNLEYKNDKGTIRRSKVVIKILKGQ